MLSPLETPEEVGDHVELCSPTGTTLLASSTSTDDELSGSSSSTGHHKEDVI